MRVVGRYRNSILPKLIKLIEKLKESDKANPDYDQRESIHHLEEKLGLYECVIGQLSPNHSLDKKQKMLNHYNSNRDKITN